MSFRLIEAERAQHPVSLLCSVAEVTRAGYYAWRSRGRSARELRDGELAGLIRRIFDDSGGTYGAPRIQAELSDDHGVRIGRKRVARLMKALGIEGVSRRRKRRYKTTIPAREAPVAPDLVHRSFQAAGPNRLWVADITYVPTWQGYLFLACVIDAWSRRVVGWSMRDDLRSELVVDALGMAVTRRRPQPGLVHHSDRAPSTRASPSARRCRTPACCRAWAAAATPSTTPSPRASSPHSRPNSSTGTRSRRVTRHDSPSSAGSRASTTAAAGTRRSDSGAHRTTKS